MGNLEVPTLILSTMAVIIQAAIKIPAAILVGSRSQVMRMKKAPQITEPMYPAERENHLVPPRLRVTPPKFSFTFSCETKGFRHFAKSNSNKEFTLVIRGLPRSLKLYHT